MSTHPKDGHYDLIAEETLRAHVDFPLYSQNILDDRKTEDPLDYKRSLLGTIFRLQHLRVEVSRRMAEFANLPPGTSVLETEKYFMKFMAIQIAEMSEDPEQMRAELSQMFGLDMVPAAAQPAVSA